MKSWIITLGAVLFSGLGAVVSVEAAQSNLTLQPAAGVPGSTISIVGKGLGNFTSTQVNRVMFGGVPALIQRWEADIVEVRVPSKAQTGIVNVLIGKKKLSAGTFTVVYPKILSISPQEIESGQTIEIIGEHFGVTAGPRDPNTMFGVNDVIIGDTVARPRRWRDDRIEVQVPANAKSGNVAIRLASSDPLQDGSCCEKVTHTVSNALPLTLIPTIRMDPVGGPVGTKVVLFGQQFGEARAEGDIITIGGHLAPIAQWTDTTIVAHVPLGAESGPVKLKVQGKERTIGDFTVHVPKVTEVSPAAAPIGTLLKIRGEHFGLYSESGPSAFAFTDFNTGLNRVDIGGVPAVIYRWQDERIDVWVPFSAKSGPIVIYRGVTKANPDGSCCSENTTVAFEAGNFTLQDPKVESYTPKSAGLDDLVTIKGSGFGAFLKTAEHAYVGLNAKSYKRKDIELNENVSRTEVLFNGIAAQVVSWTDTEIVARVPRRHLFGLGKKGEYLNDIATGPLIVRRGSWDVLPDGTCCTPKQWLTVEAGTFTIEAKGLPDPSYYQSNRPDANTNQ
ncbi:IPT/TIG domain-containing protein [Petrachloros mirabilis]